MSNYLWFIFFFVLTQDGIMKLSWSFYFNQTDTTFWTKFAQKEYFQFKRGHINIIIEFNTFELVEVVNFILNQQLWFFWTKLAQKVYFQSSTNKKIPNKHYSWIQHIWISVGTKFCLNQTILSCWFKLTQKEYFCCKKENLSTSIKFSTFQLD